MLRINLLIENTDPNKHSDIDLRIIYQNCKIKLTRRYFLYIYILFPVKCIERGAV